MRSKQHRETLEFVRSLYEAQEEIKDALRQGRYAEAQVMLGECQEFAVALGESIEKTEGEGHVTVFRIEEYCESLYRAYQEISDGSVQEKNLYRSLKHSLLKVENSIKYDIRVRKEVVFFPYKAAMWDSLESIYLAARRDPDCDAYCVPVPYFDLKPDHSFGQMHYEGGEYPSNIEVTDWQEYRFEERKPDVVYIHNAYDNWNLVTSVHPRFYSENLKKHTNKLIYVPYFILGDIKPEDTDKIQRMKHFCFLPGIVHADKIVLQSEDVRKIYIHEYQKVAIKSGIPELLLDSKNLKKKFLGIGSPKLDKILTMRSQNVELPEEWRNLIYQTDKKCKKVILYNNSIAAMLRYGEQMIDKIERIFEVFKEHQDKVTLWWRPHPLIQSTIQAMCPALWNQYQGLVKRYIDEGWGIYDATADIHRAVAVCDAYYGDWSSVVQLFEHLGKLILIVDCEL